MKFSIEPKQGDWSLFQDHILEIICNNDKKVNEWLLTWMSQIVQKTDRIGTAIIFQGEQGIGKSIFLSNYGKLFGDHFLQIFDWDMIYRFNKCLKNIHFLSVDGDQNFSKMEAIAKAVITENTLAIEEKGKEIVHQKNLINCAIVLNKKWEIPLTVDGRRFMILNVSNKRKGDEEYFKNIMRELWGGGYQAMLYDLLKYDILKINVTKIC